MSEKYDQLFSSHPASDEKTDNPSLDSYKEASSFERKHRRGHLTKRLLGDGTDVIYTVDSCFRIAVDYRLD